MSQTVRRIMGALQSGNPAAYFALGLMAAKPVCRFIDQLSPSKPVDTRRALPQVAFVVGAPRSGSTLTFQLLAYFLPCAYPTNLFTLFPRHTQGSLPTGRQAPPLKSYYGHTPSRYGVNEYNEFYDALLAYQSKGEFRKHFAKTVHRLSPNSKPVIIKNVGAYRGISQLASAIPELKFVRVHRDEITNACSVLDAYEEIGWMNPIPPSMSHLDPKEDPPAYALTLIRKLNADIDRQLKDLESDRTTAIRYEDMLKDPESSIAGIAERAMGLDPKQTDISKIIPALQASAPHARSSDRRKHLRERIEDAAQRIERGDTPIA